MNNPTISTAINNRQVLNFVYGEKPRIVEPHAYGLDAKGNGLLRGYQVDGESATNPKAWKLFSVDKIDELAVSPQSFTKARSGYKKGDRVMDVIFAQLDET